MTAKMVRCPQCGAAVEYRLDNPARPFCSSRCKLIDLGAWAEERYAIGNSNELSENLAAEDALSTQHQSDSAKPGPGVN